MLCCKSSVTVGGIPGQLDGPCLKGFAYLSQKLVLPSPLGTPVGPLGVLVPSYVISLACIATETVKLEGS